jgi:hypothetical protein
VLGQIVCLGTWDGLFPHAPHFSDEREALTESSINNRQNDALLTLVGLISGAVNTKGFTADARGLVARVLHRDSDTTMATNANKYEHKWPGKQSDRGNSVKMDE